MTQCRLHKKAEKSIVDSRWSIAGISYLPAACYLSLQWTIVHGPFTFRSPYVDAALCIECKRLKETTSIRLFMTLIILVTIVHFLSGTL
jgi:hypothetical protein